MKAEIRLPDNFTEYRSDGIFSNLTNEIDYLVVKAIKYKPLSAALTAWDYFGVVWWDDDIGYWCVEIWQFNKYKTTHISESFEDLIQEIQEKYGYK
ncbi:hypothetical protein WJU16_03385 [Chitinophaga pollutisoli]|uniref:Phage protein n=1 Tax=Chitinophaga pollutisoli TaxID=3133966 RepID=A0ABZ2YRF6_9BACT